MKSLPPSGRICSVCNISAPQTESEYTLISSRYGWRLKREKLDFIYLLNWFCPKCWEKEKEKVILKNNEVHKEKT